MLGNLNHDLEVFDLLTKTHTLQFDIKMNYLLIILFVVEVSIKIPKLTLKTRQ